MRIYLDACSLQRPLDDRSQPRIHVEAEAILAVLRLVEAGQFALLSSEALIYETRRIPDDNRRAQALAMLGLASESIDVDGRVEAQAEALVREGIKPMEALHLASAIVANADYFCTCDDVLLRKARAVGHPALRTVSPLELASEVMP